MSMARTKESKRLVGLPQKEALVKALTPELQLPNEKTPHNAGHRAWGAIAGFEFDEERTVTPEGLTNWYIRGLAGNMNAVLLLRPVVAKRVLSALTPNRRVARQAHSYLRELWDGLERR